MFNHPDLMRILADERRQSLADDVVVPFRRTRSGRRRPHSPPGSSRWSPGPGRDAA